MNLKSSTIPVPDSLSSPASSNITILETQKYTENNFFPGNHEHSYTQCIKQQRHSDRIPHTMFRVSHAAFRIPIKRKSHNNNKVKSDEYTYTTIKYWWYPCTKV